MKYKSNILSMLFFVHRSVPFYITAMIICSAITAFLNIAELFINRLIIYKILGSKFEIKTIVLYLIIFSFFSYIIYQIQIIINNKFKSIKSIKVSKDLLEKIFQKIRLIDLSSYENKKFYDDYIKALNEVDTRAFQLIESFTSLFSSLLTLLFITVIFFDPIYLLLGIIMVIKELFYINKINKINFDYDKDFIEIQRKLKYYENIFSSSNSIKEIKSNQACYLFLSKNEQEIEREYLLKKKYYYKSLPFSILSVILSQGANFLIAISIGSRVLNHTINAGDFVFLFNSFLMFITNMTSIFRIIPEIKKHNRYIGNLKSFLEYIPQISESSQGIKSIKKLQPEIIFEHVSFAYPSRPEILVIQDLSLKIKHGEKIAIVGKNGAGKSTFLKLLLYLYPANGGIITYGGSPLSAYCTKVYRSLFGTVFQDFQTYSFTIAENILMHEQLKEEESIVEEALQFSGMLERVLALPKGIQTNITKEFDPEGVYFSGGEYQRLAISRAYAKTSEILIFDEPSSALDPIIEAQLFQELLELGKNKTVFFVSHRLASTVKADKILVFDNGKLIEQGTHEELMNMNLIYAELFRCQSEGYIKN